MSKKYQQQEESQVDTGADTPAGTENDAGADTPADAGTEGEAQSTEVPEPQPEVKTIGIGQFVRHLLLHSKKTNTEILELVLKRFEGSKTTPACIAWYKTDLRKKGLLEGLHQRGKNKTVAFSAEELEELCK